MKRIVLWCTAVACMGLAFVWVLCVAEAAGKRPDKASAASGTSQATAASPAPVPQGTVVYTFQDDDALRQFAGLWQQRQNALMRMLVLQGYVQSEQALVSRIEEKLVTDYRLDAQKQYFFDTQRRVVLELPPSSASQASTPSSDCPTCGSNAKGATP